MRRLIPLPLVVLVLVAACGEGSPGDLPSPADSGIHGKVVQGPMCPVMQAGSPCPDVPWNGTIHLTGGAGVDLEVSTFDGGTFAIAIPPGTYELEPLLDGPGPPTAGSQTVVVPSHGTAEVTLTVDSGIR